MSPTVHSLTSTIGLILLAMLALSMLELAIPLHSRSARSAAHLKPNLALTFLTFFTNAFLNSAVLLVLVWLHARGWGLLNVFVAPPFVATAIVILALDFAFYVLHVAMHKVPGLWRVHRVHHSDPALDVTTTIRQHPGESVARYAAISVVATAIGASPMAFGIYRLASVLNGLLEHANIELPRPLDTALSWVTTWPNAHKVHHSREASETDSNYGNLLSCWDRLFSTFTPAHRGATVVFGLDGYDDPLQQTTTGLLAMPFVEREPETVGVPG